MKRWRRLATCLNLLLIVVAVSLLVAHVIRPAPRTSGIIEMTPQERARYDAALNRVIEDVEARYGLRPSRPLAPGERAAPGSIIDAETVREIESYYAKKQLRDQARAGPKPRSAAPHNDRQTLADQGANGVDLMEHPLRTVFTV